MARKRNTLHNKDFYLRRANAARQLPLEFGEDQLYKCRGDCLKYDELQARARELLKRSVFEQDAHRDGRDHPLAPMPFIGYLLGRFYLQTFEQIAAGGIRPAVPQVLDTIRIDGRGKISVSVSSLSFGYRRFLADLQFFDGRRIKQCPECHTIFYGRQNSICCSPNCTQKRWKAVNPVACHDAQFKRDTKRKEIRALARLRKEEEQVRQYGTRDNPKDTASSK